MMHPWSRPWFRLSRAACVPLCALLCCASAGAADPSGRKPAVSNYQTIYKEVMAFRNAKEAAQRKAHADKILAFGRPGASQLYRHLRSDTGRRLSTYVRAVRYHGGRIYGQTRLQVPEDEVQQLRDAVNALRDKKDLGKDEIVKTGDPALARLRELLLPPRDLWAKLPEKVRVERALVLELCGYRRACETVLGIKAPDLQAKVKTLEEDALESIVLQNKELQAVAKYNASAARRIHPLEAKGVRDLNILRFVLGQAPLRIDVRLCQAARGHSRDMAEKGFFNHTSPAYGRKTPWDRAKRAGTKANAENIFMGSSDPIKANAGWFHSPGHHKNMLNPAMFYVGLGHHKGRWTQMLRK